MDKKSKYYKMGEKIGKNIGNNADGGKLLLIFMLCLFIVLAIVFVILAIEALVLWGLGSLALWLIGINATITFGQCFGVVVLIDVLAGLIKKIFD